MDDSNFYTQPAGPVDPADARLPVRFSFEPKLDVEKSDKEKRNVYRDVEYITILIPGDKTLSVHRPVMPVDKQRFPTQYASWKANQGDAARVVDGTPVSGLAGITPAQLKDLSYFNVFTIEQLAEMADGFAANMMGIQQLKQTAKRYVLAAREAAPMLKIQGELDKRDNTIAALQAQVEQLAARIPAPTAPKAPKEK